MKTKFFLTVFVALTLVATLGWSAGSALASPVCDSAFVTQSGSVITVKPTGVDDTANIQCAFDAAVASGPGVSVRLKSGTFHTAQIVVNNFQGKFTGAGAKNTVIVNLPNLNVNTDEIFFRNFPSASNPWPTVFAFVNGNFVISDLSIQIAGDKPTTGWYYFGFKFEELCHAITVIGKQADVRVERVLVEGEPMEDSVYGYNVLNGILFAGTGYPVIPISGSFEVYDSTFRQMASGSPVAHTSHANVVIGNNIFEDVFFGMDGGDFADSSFEFSHNSVEAIIGLDLYNVYFAEDVRSSLLVKNNIFRGIIGLALEQTFGVGNQCLIQGNNVQGVTDIGIYLGPGIQGCTVIGGANKTNVLDLGTDNVLVGVNNMGTGVSPFIQHFLKPNK